MADMSEETVDQAPVQEVSPTTVNTTLIQNPDGSMTEYPSFTAAPEKKKRGRKPKVPVPPPAPVIVAATAPKPRKRRIPEVHATKGERAIAAAISAAQVDRVKCIAKCAKVMQLQSAEKGVLESIDWQIAMLKGTPLPNPTQGPGYLQPQFPLPPAYPAPLPNYTPPSMRQSALPIDPRANGGAEGIVDDTENDDPDKFLKGSGGVVGGGQWLG